MRRPVNIAIVGMGGFARSYLRDIEKVAGYGRPVAQVAIAADHQIFDLYKVKAELGYRDPVDPVEALQRTVNWYRENPPVVPEQFATDLAENYSMEDDIVPAYREACTKWSKIDHFARDYHHSYPHPKKPGLSKDHRER